MTRLAFGYGQTRDSERTYLDHRLFACYLVYESTSVLVRYILPYDMYDHWYSALRTLSCCILWIGDFNYIYLSHGRESVHRKVDLGNTVYFSEFTIFTYSSTSKH